MDLKLADVIDIPALQRLLADFHRLTQIPLAVLDEKGQVLAGFGWVDICTRFHRAHPEALQNCTKSDTQLSQGSAAGEYRLYKCANNMCDVATPLIIDGKCVGNLFTGQFFLTGEEPDLSVFKEQARRYGFPEEEYLAALGKVPRRSREHVDATMKFFAGLAQGLAQSGWSRIRLARSVAEQERAADVLRASERRLSHAQKIAHLGIWEFDAASERLACSDEMCAILGLEPRAFDGTFKAFLARVHPEDRRAFMGRYSELPDRGRDDYELEFRIVRASTGEVRAIHAKGERVRDESGRIAGSRGMAHDITEIKAKENELRRINRMLSARSRSDQAMVRATDERDFLNEVCKIVVDDCGHAMAWIGWAEQDEGKTVRPAAFAGCAEEDLETLKARWADTERGRGPTGKAIRTGKPSICRNIRTDPNMRFWRKCALKLGYASCAVVPLLADGKALGVIAVYSRTPDAFTDAEVKLLTGLADDLAYGIGTLRMRAARKQAETGFQQAQKLEAVGLMAGGIAHDFNNILASILGYNDLLLEGLKGDPLHEFSLEIKRSAETAAMLTHQLLGVSGNRGAQRRLLDPNCVIMALAKMLRRLLGEKIRLDLKLQESVWPLMMDSGQVEQIVMNLAVNARDAMADGGRITVATKNLLVGKGRDSSLAPSPRGRCVVIEVRDNGSGMDAAVQARIFEPFFTTKEKGKGTGLGLPTVKSIVDEYGGSLSVESKPGHGAVFRVVLPNTRAGRKGASSGRKSPVQQGHRGYETILVVEDNAGLGAVVKMNLERAGYSVFSAPTAEEALSRYDKAKKRIDLLLTDVVLPDMDGPELAKRLKKLRPGMRTVYMSGYPGNALAPITGFGGCALLEKPFSSAQMLKTVREVLDVDQGSLF